MSVNFFNDKFSAAENHHNTEGLKERYGSNRSYFKR